MVFIGLLIIIVSAVNVIAPQAMWYLNEGWKFKDAEPSDAALVLGRIGGVVGIGIGLFVMFQ